MRRLLNREEVLQVLNCSPDTFARHQRRGLKVIRVGRQVFVADTELARFMKLPRRGRGRPRKTPLA